MPFNSADLKKLHIVDWSYTEMGKALSYSRYSQWVEEGHARPLAYLADERKNLREDLQKVFPSFQSALVFLFSYADFKKMLHHFYQSSSSSSSSSSLRIGAYALGFEGDDYHVLLRQYLQAIADDIKKSHPDMEVAFSLDVHPVLERDLAYRSGLGWFGKNSMLINRRHGSYTMIGSLILSQKLSAGDLQRLFPDSLESLDSLESWRPKERETDHCGQCRACIDACPTKAIDEHTRTLSAQKCISTFTIEIFKEGTPPPSGFVPGKSEIFGCDICQDVCPWNRKILGGPNEEGKWTEAMTLKGPKLHLIFDFFLRRKVPLIVEELRKLSNKGFQRLFHGTAFARTGRRGILKNLTGENE